MSEENLIKSTIRAGEIVVRDVSKSYGAAHFSKEVVKDCSFTIERGKHEWPGARPKPGNDPVSHALDATARIWAFFAAHPRT